MGVIPGKRETMQDRLIKIIERDASEIDGYIILRTRRSRTSDNCNYKIIEAYKYKKLKRYITKKYDDDLINADKDHILVSALYVNGKHEMDEILYGLDINEDYIYTG